MGVVVGQQNPRHPLMKSRPNILLSKWSSLMGQPREMPWNDMAQKWRQHLMKMLLIHKTKFAKVLG